MTGPVKYTKEVVKEGKRVRWPHREELVPMIIVVVVISVFAAIFLALEDLTAGSLISQLKTAFGGK
jgi:preprotein translocase SecE subunit